MDQANTLQFSTQSNVKFEQNFLKSIKIRSISYTFEIPLQMASRWSWPETVKNTGLSKYSPSFCAIDWLLSLLIDCDDFAAAFIDWFVLLIDCWGSRAFIVVILNTSPPPSQSFDVNIGVWIWI